MLVVACGLQVPPNVDQDNDLRRDSEDNCPTVGNPDQSNFDGDELGDACDVCESGETADEDDDGIPDACDGCVSSGEDVDGDDVPDNCDPCVGSGEDVDGDGVDDACDKCVGNNADLDFDGVPDGCDSCVAIGPDTDNDGLVNACDPCNLGPQHDEDGDGVMDACDNCKATPNAPPPGEAQPDAGDNSLTPDGVGDACDSDPAFNRELFDPFTTQNASWYVQGSGWLLENDTMTANSALPTYRAFGDAIGAFKISTVAVALLGNSSEESFGVFISQYRTQETPSRASCVVRQGAFAQGLAEVLLTASDGNTVTLPASGEVLVPSNASYAISLFVDAASKNLYCTVNETTVNVAFPTETIVWHPGLEARGGISVAFNYFDIITY